MSSCIPVARRRQPRTTDGTRGEASSTFVKSWNGQLRRSSFSIPAPARSRVAVPRELGQFFMIPTPSLMLCHVAHVLENGLISAPLLDPDESPVPSQKTFGRFPYFLVLPLFNQLPGSLWQSVARLS